MRFGLTGIPKDLQVASAADAGVQAAALLRTCSDQDLTKSLEAVDGVGAVKVGGGLEDEIHVLADQGKLAELHLTNAARSARASRPRT